MATESIQASPPRVETSSTTRARLVELVRQNRWTILLVTVPVLFFVYLAWTHRFMSDDGFINVRVVQQIMAGNGPVFNAGERVETATSPLWVLALLIGKIPMFWLPTEWVAVVVGIGMTTAAVVMSVVAAARAFHTTRLVPLGLIVYIAIPPAASYASSGLENGLSALWIASWYLALLRAADSRRGRDALPAAVLIGLGPLVRPDLAVMSVVAGAALLYLSRPRSMRRAGTLIGAALVVPVAFEVFRMCYFGNLLPNTAYAKEATGADWVHGWQYLVDLVHPYLLWVAGLLVVAAAALTWRRQTPPTRATATPAGPTRPNNLVALATPAVAGIIYGAFIVRGGGDFMHGRLLLPAVFAVVLPVAAVPRRAATSALAAATLLWALVPLVAGGPPYHGIGPQRIDDEPGLLASEALRSNPVSLHDYRHSPLMYLGVIERRRAEAGDGAVRIFTLGGPPIPEMALDPNGPDFTRDGDVYSVGAIGMFSVAAGPRVYIADALSLADPIGSRFELSTRTRAGHDKFVRPSWVIARFADPAAPAGKAVPAAEIQAARRALTCPEVAALLDRARAPLSVSRLWTNFVQSITSFSTRVNPNPVIEAARCRGGS